MSEPNKVFTYGVCLGIIGFFIGIFAPVAGLFVGAIVAALGLYSRKVNRTGGLVIIIWGLFLVVVSAGLWWYFGSPIWFGAFG